MVYSYKELLKKYQNRNGLYKALEEEQIYKLEHGIYSNEKIVDPLVLYSKKYPNGIITMDSAFYFYHLTDVIPNKTHLATDRKSSIIKNEKIFQIFIPKEILNAGKIKLDIQGGTINIYYKERLLSELIRKRNQIPFDYYKEIISNYREIAHELDMYKIEEYLSLFKNGDNLFEVMQREVF